ncbi:MAG: LuxR C-terminal-related transcriptional regulator [Paracoccaceae bacterium]
MERSSLALFSYQPMMAEILQKRIAKSGSLTITAATVVHGDVVEIARQHKPDLFVVDCGQPDRGIATIRVLREVSPKTKIVLFTGIENPEHAVIALDAGVAGYISSACTKIDVLDALELIASGQTFISPHVAAWVIGRMRASSEERRQAVERRMTHREEQIARFLVQGWTNRAIADRLGLTEKTIKYYMSNMMQKFAARNRLELAMALPKAPEGARFFQ